MKHRIPFSFLMFMVVVVMLEAGVRSVAGKAFLLHYAEYKQRHEWFSELRTQSAYEEGLAKNGKPEEICVLGTSSTSSFMSKTKTIQETMGFHFYDLSTALCGGESLLLMLAKTSFLPEQKVIFCLSEFSWSQPFNDGAFCDLISLPVSWWLLQLYLESPTARAHPLYQWLLKGACYDMLQTARYSQDFQHAFKNYFAVHFLGTSLVTPEEQQKNFEKIRENIKQQEIIQAQGLTSATDAFKQLFFSQVLLKFQSKQKKVIILRMRYHSRLEKVINPDIRNSCDALILAYCQKFSLPFIDMGKDLLVDDSDFWDYTHFNDKGAQKIIKNLGSILKRDSIK